jgi:alpha-beta hydrolase superfamily lysophospholipase
MEKDMTNNLYFENISSDPNPKGVFIISHGMAEHMGRYQWLISQLNNDGYHVISRDHKGHGINIINGETPGLFSENNGWLKVRDDLKECINHAERKFQNLPCFLLGHSMGSWIALSTLNSKSSLKAIILTGSSKLPKLAIILNLIIIKVDILINGKFNKSTIMDRLTMRRFNAEFKPNRTPNDWISSDEDSVNDYTNDPHCGFIVTSSLWLDLCNGLMMIFNKRYYSELNKDIPILIISGEYDVASNNSKLAKKLKDFLMSIFSNVSFKIVKDCRHEVYTEVNKLSSYNYLINYIKQF